MMSRRGIFTRAFGALAAYGLTRRTPAEAARELAMQANTSIDIFDFETKGLEGWTTVDGQWAVEDMPGAPSGKKVIVQRATRNAFNVIVAPSGPYTDVDVSMKFKPISGREDASGGIVFRFTDGKYYVVRANALEDNFRLYSYDRGTPPARHRQRQDAGAGAMAHRPPRRAGRSHASVARRQARYRPSGLAVQVRSGGTVDEGRFDHRIRRPHHPRGEERRVEQTTNSSERTDP